MVRLLASPFGCPSAKVPFVYGCSVEVLAIFNMQSCARWRFSTEKYGTHYIFVWSGVSTVISPKKYLRVAIGLSDLYFQKHIFNITFKAIANSLNHISTPSKDFSKSGPDNSKSFKLTLVDLAAASKTRHIFPVCSRSVCRNAEDIRLYYP